MKLLAQNFDGTFVFIASDHCGCGDDLAAMRRDIFAEYRVRFTMRNFKGTKITHAQSQIFGFRPLYGGARRFGRRCFFLGHKILARISQ
jgi:hypothetical protein